MRKTVSSASLFLLISALSGRDAPADDVDILWLGARVEPNVIILLDSSGSMDDYVEGARKMTSAKTAVTNLLQNTTGVRFGIMRFNQQSNGARMVSPVGTSVSAMVSAVNAITPAGYTPLGRSTINVEDYLRGEFQQQNSTRSWSAASADGTTARTPASASKGKSKLARPVAPGDPVAPLGWRRDWDDDSDRDRDRYGDRCDDDDDDGGCGDGTVSYASPIQYECQKNFVIVVTDGLPNGEDTDLVVTAAGSLHNNDLADWLPNSQTAQVYTVGFDIAEGSDLLTRAAAAGGGRFFTTSNATQLTQALNEALGDIIEQTYAFTAPVIPSGSIASASRAYFSSFRPNPARAFWRGYFSAYTRGSNGLIPVDSEGLPLQSSLAWEAGNVLTSTAPSSRTIYTYASSARQAFTTANSSITTALLGASTATDKNNIINFIRGVDVYDEDADGNTTEARAWKLGDIFHSGPVLVTPPPLNLSDSTYQSFKAANASRTKFLLVGANDGMVHAFRESDGTELWGFIPPDLLTKLKNLRPGSSSHQYFVDGTIAVTDIKVGTVWKTIAVFGERRGGKRYFAIDVTDPANPAWFWSFTDTRSGESWSDPALGRIKMADNSTKYVAFVGGGYDSVTNNATGKAMFAIDLSNGTKLWQYYNTGSGDANYMNFSIASTPTILDLNQDGFIDRIYVGDVGGQLWKFDTAAKATTSSGLINNWTGKRLFVASPSQSNPPASGAYRPAQGFYGQPIVAYDENAALWVFQGSGDRNNPNDASSNNFYAIKDNTNMTNGTQLTTTSLVAAPVTNTTITQGWYLPLGSKEKVLAEAMIHNKVVYFTTFTPLDVATCDQPGGDAKLYAVQMANGDAAIDWTNGNSTTGESSASRSTSVGSGIPSNPAVVSGTTTDAIVVSTTDGEISSTNRPASAGKRLRYWREIF